MAQSGYHNRVAIFISWQGHVIRKSLFLVSWSLIFLTILAASPVLAQGMGRMMGMGGRGGGGRSKQSGPSTTVDPTLEHFNPFAPDADPIEGINPRTDAMEKFIYGRIDAKMAIEARVERLEKKLIPYDHHAAKQEMKKRVDRLWSVLASANKPVERE